MLAIASANERPWAYPGEETNYGGSGGSGGDGAGIRQGGCR